jgi:hypothetical protein
MNFNSFTLPYQHNLNLGLKIFEDSRHLDWILHYLPKELLRYSNHSIPATALTFLEVPSNLSIKNEFLNFSSETEFLVEEFTGKYLRCFDINKNRICFDENFNSVIKCTYSENNEIPSHIEITYVSTDNPSLKSSFILRAYREISKVMLYNEGYNLVHASMTTQNGNVTAFIGNKGAGKSAWLIKNLKSGESFLTNDRAFVNFNNLKTIPYNIAAMVSKETLKHLSESLLNKIDKNLIIRRDHQLAGYNKVGLSPLEICYSYNNSLVHEGNLNKVFFLEQTSSSLKDFEIKKIYDLNEIEHLLDQNDYTQTDPTYKSGIYSRPPIFKSIKRKLDLKKISFYRLSFKWEWFDLNFDKSINEIMESYR